MKCERCGKEFEAQEYDHCPACGYVSKFLADYWDQAEMIHDQEEEGAFIEEEA